MPKKNNGSSAVEQEFDRLQAENMVPIKPVGGLAGRNSDVNLGSTGYGPDPESPSDKLISANNNVDPLQITGSESVNIPSGLVDDVIPHVDTKAGPGLEHLRTTLDKDVDPISALNADEEK